MIANALKVCHQISLQDAARETDKVYQEFKERGIPPFETQVYCTNLIAEKYQEAWEIHRVRLNLPNINRLISKLNGEAILDAFDEGFITFAGKVIWLLDQYDREGFLPPSDEQYQTESTVDNQIWKLI